MKIFLSACVACAMIALLLQTASNAAPMAGTGGPRLGSPGGGPVIDKSGDMLLQQMINASLPKFVQERFVDEKSGVAISYNLFRPTSAASTSGKPLVLFMADASTPGNDVLRPLLQGYGGLVWATEEWQAINPCYVLVPQFSGVAVNDDYERSIEVDAVLRLVKHIAATENVDKNKIYTTGQSMGGMISMYYSTKHPNIFAASLFVDCHWNPDTFPELVRSTFTLITAGNSGKSFANISEIENAAHAIKRPFAFAEWSAKLPLSEQDKLANTLFSKGAPINIINFTPKTVLPADGKGSEHMYSFDYAYRLRPVMEWLFRQSK